LARAVILVVAPTAEERAFAARALEACGHVVEEAASIEDASGARDRAVAIVLHAPASEIVGACRSAATLLPSLPLLLLSDAVDAKARVAALDAGADDVVALPIGADDLAVHVCALLRRGSRRPRLRWRAIEIHRDERRATVAGERLALTDREYAILRALVERAGDTVSRAELRACIDDGGSSRSNAIDVHVSNLRAKLGVHAHLVETVRGGGYRLRGA